MQTTKGPIFTLEECEGDIRQTKKAYENDTNNIGSRDDYLVALYLLGRAHLHDKNTRAARDVFDEMKDINQYDIYTGILEEKLSNLN